MMSRDSLQETILVVCDALDNVDILSQALKNTYEIVQAAVNSETVERVCSKQPVNLILLDILVPDEDSLQLCRSLKERSQTSWIPIIILSASHREKDIVSSFSVGVADYIRKPYKLSIVKERIKSQLELLRARNAAELASKIKGEFLANMSHEIRTPLNAIIGMNRLALESGKREEQAYYGRIVQESAEGLLGLLNDILDFSKIEAGQLELDNHNFDMGRVMEAVINSLELKAREKGIALSHIVAPELKLDCRGDSLRLRQILFNLVQNAIKFTSEGSVTLKAEPHGAGSAQGDKSSFHFTVTDTGRGIPLDKQKKIFTAFSQVDTSNSRLFGGTGLGLSIARQLVELMEGEIWLDSSPGSGTVFHLILSFPGAVKTGADKPLAAKDDKFSIAPQSEESKAPVGSLLLVEDDKFNRILAQTLIQRIGYAVTVAENGLRALEILSRQRFDIIIMDVQMPELDGLNASRLIRQCEQGSAAENIEGGALLPEGITESLKGTHTPIIALTAHAMKGDREACLAAGMNDYLTKPILPERLEEILTKLQMEKAEGQAT
ncbi:MAG: response regulator [Thermodesulfobacteriota bacterium]